MEIVPHVGIGDIRLGMPREVADRIRAEWRQSGRFVKLDSAGSPSVVTFIDVASDSRARYRGIDLFGGSADEVVAAVVRLEGLDPLDYPPGKHNYRFPALNLLLWRGSVSDELDTQGYTFESASVHTQDCFQGAALRALLRETTHRAAPGTSRVSESE